RSRGLSRSPFQDRRLVRLDEAWLGLPNRWGIPVEVCAGAEVPIEPAAVDELGSVLQTAQTLERLAPGGARGLCPRRGGTPRRGARVRLGAPHGADAGTARS